MQRHPDGQIGGPSPGFGKKGLPDKEDRETLHIDDKDFKKGKSTSEQRGDEDEL